MPMNCWPFHECCTEHSHEKWVPLTVTYSGTVLSRRVPSGEQNPGSEPVPGFLICPASFAACDLEMTSPLSLLFLERTVIIAKAAAAVGVAIATEYWLLYG